VRRHYTVELSACDDHAQGVPRDCRRLHVRAQAAEQTPLSALAVAALAEEAGVPPGVFNVVTGDADDAPLIGGEMTSNPIVRSGLTGSTASANS